MCFYLDLLTFSDQSKCNRILDDIKENDRFINREIIHF